MDPMSAVGVAAAAAQFAGLTLRLSNTLMQFILSIKEAPRRSRELISEILLVSDVLDELKSVLDAAPQTETSLVDAIEKFASFLKELNSCTEVRENDVKKRLKWPFTEKQNKEYLEKLERFKSTFNFALNTSQAYLFLSRSFE